MTRKTRSLIGAAAVLAILVIIYLGQTNMGWFQNDSADLRSLLTPRGAVLTDGATIKAWQPDPNYKPQNYYLIRPIDEAGFTALSSQLGLSVKPAPDQSEAIWRLPPGLTFDGWSPAADSAQDASGDVGGGAVWLRWQDGRLFAVVLRTAP